MGAPRLSDWSKYPLGDEQIYYAAADALAGVLIYEHFRMKSVDRLTQFDRVKSDQPLLSRPIADTFGGRW